MIFKEGYALAAIRIENHANPIRRASPEMKVDLIESGSAEWRSSQIDPITQAKGIRSRVSPQLMMNHVRNGSSAVVRSIPRVVSIILVRKHPPMMTIDCRIPKIV